MGYLSQVVQDARPRATPSLYAHAAVAPKAAAEPLSYARLMESGGVPDAVPNTQSGTASRALNAEATEGDEVSNPSPQVRPQVSVRPDGQVALAPTHPIKPDVRLPSHMTEPAKGGASPPSDIVPNHASSPQHQPQISGATPRPASFEMSSPALEASVIHPRADAPTRNVTPQEQTPDVQAAGPSENAETFGPRVLATDSTPSQPASIVPRITAAQSQSNSAPAATPSQNHPAFQSAAPAHPSAPAEVHIGEVEIIVQDPPTPRAPPAPRAVNAPPASARYHIRRL